VPYKEPEIEKIYYSIGEVARITGTSPSSIRYWENNFDELSPHRNTKGTRFFNAGNIETIKLIKYLVKERGMTIKGAQQKLKDNREETLNNREIVKRLESIKEILTGVRDEMKDKHHED